MSAGGKQVRVLVVEDSAVVREQLVHIISGDPRLEVVGTAGDGLEAIEQARLLAPDVITMDIHMPYMDGLEATRLIMERTPTPIVVVSSSSARSEVAATFRIVEAGALAIVAKPWGVVGEDVRKLLDTIRLMAAVKVVRRWPRGPAARAPADTNPRPRVPVRLVAIGASTGGPLVLKTILSGLGQHFPVPVAITQHISPGFTDGFVSWLAQASGFPVLLPGEGDTLVHGCAYVAPDGAHLAAEPDGLGGVRARLDGGPPENGHRPAVSRLFRSVANSFGPAAVGVLLSGMGRDGAAELKLLRDRGAVTIAQSLESAVVPGMPGVALELGAAAHVLAPAAIAPALRRVVGCADAPEASVD